MFGSCDVKSESVVTYSGGFIIYYKSATFLLVPPFLPLLDPCPLCLLCVSACVAMWMAR